MSCSLPHSAPPAIQPPQPLDKDPQRETPRHGGAKHGGSVNNAPQKPIKDVLPNPKNSSNLSTPQPLRND